MGAVPSIWPFDSLPGHTSRPLKRSTMPLVCGDFGRPPGVRLAVGELLAVVGEQRADLERRSLGS